MFTAGKFVLGASGSAIPEFAKISVTFPLKVIINLT